MILYRISTAERARDLSGTGAKLYGGRWNSPGNPVVYTAQTISLAMLEKLVYASRYSLKNPFALTLIKVENTRSLLELSATDLPEAWMNFPFSAATVEIGNQWLQNAQTAILKVPSAVNPFEFNFLLNPMHNDFFTISIEEVLPISFDLRLS